jgi:AGZA family xanthine/uracil permease-like MFS transporter
MIILGQFLGAAGITPATLPAHLQRLHQTLTMLANGFILTGLLWGSLLAFLIDHKARAAALCAALCAVLTLFGVIHSVAPSGALYLPWQIATQVHYMLAVAYLTLTAILLSLSGRHTSRA